MVTKITQKMNDLKIIMLNKNLNRGHSLVNKLSESHMKIEKSNNPMKKSSSSQNNLSETHKDKVLFQISESKEDDE